jgi:hypothetical protein
VTKAPRVPHHDSSTDSAGRGRRASLGYASALSAIGIPGGLILALLGLPFYDRNSNRSMRSRPVAALRLAAVLGSTAQPEYRDTFPEPMRKDAAVTTPEKKP